MTPVLKKSIPDEKARLSALSAAWVGALLIFSYFPVLQALVHQWHANEDMGHGFFVPLIAGYIAWERRHTITAVLEHANAGEGAARWGLVLLAWGAVQLFIATLGAELFLQRSAFLISLTGAILYLGGVQLVRVLLFPLLLLLFMIPLPGLLLKSITFPLQLLSTRLAESALDSLGYLVVRDGNILELAGQELSVVEACSGIRSLLSLSFFTLSYSYLFDSRVSTRWLLLLATPFVAILANAGRIVITGMVGDYDQELASHFFHSASGWVIFVLSIGCLMAIHKLILVLQRHKATH